MGRLTQSDPRNKDGLVFCVGDKVRLLKMPGYEDSHLLNKRVGEEIIIEEFFHGGAISVPAPERGDGGSVWAWSINYLELIKDEKILEKDFDEVF